MTLQFCSCDISAILTLVINCTLLAHLSRRLVDELIVYTSIQRPSVRPSVHISFVLITFHTPFCQSFINQSIRLAFLLLYHVCIYPSITDLDPFFRPSHELTVYARILYHLSLIFLQPSLLANLSRRLIGELIVYEGIRRPSVRRPSVRLSTFSNDISSEAVRPILSILHT